MRRPTSSTWTPSSCAERIEFSLTNFHMSFRQATSTTAAIIKRFWTRRLSLSATMSGKRSRRLPGRPGNTSELVWLHARKEAFTARPNGGRLTRYPVRDLRSRAFPKEFRFGLIYRENFRAAQRAFWGNSPETVVTQILAKHFTVDPSDVVIGYADSDPGFNGFGPGGSRYTVMVTGAIVTASGKLKQKLKKLAGHLLEANEADLEFRGGAVGTKGVPGMEKTIAELALMGNFFRMSFPDDPDFDSGLENNRRVRSSTFVAAAPGA